MKYLAIQSTSISDVFLGLFGVDCIIVSMMEQQKSRRNYTAKALGDLSDPLVGSEISKSKSRNCPYLSGLKVPSVSVNHIVNELPTSIFGRSDVPMYATRPSAPPIS